MDLRAVIFVPALAASVILGFVFLMFAAHHYLTVMQSAGAGARKVEWVSEPFLDNFWKVFYLAWLVGLWLGPAFFVGRALASAGDAKWVGYALPLGFLWLMYPVSQLSSLSSSTIWLPLNPDVFARMAQKPGVVLGFLLLSAGVVALFGVALHWAFFTKGQLDLLLAGAPLLVLSGLVYGQLLGRLAFALMYTKPLFARKKKKEPKPDESFRDPRTAEQDREEEEAFVQPAELPPLQTPHDGELSGYGVRFDDEPVKPKKRVVAEVADEPKPKPKRADRKRPATEKRREWTEEDEDDSAYGVRDAEATPEEASPKAVIKPSEVEMRLLSRDDAPKPPKRVWGPEVFAFLGQPDTLAVAGLLTVLCLLAGGAVRIAREFNPVG
jgi:hypothetical protein